MSRLISTILLTGLTPLALAARPAWASIFFDSLGFEDDVDIVVDVDGEFLVVAEESEDGSDAKVTIIDLDLATGAPIGVSFVLEDVLGFENGVDPMVLHPTGGGHIILIPTESEDGSQAGIHVFEVVAATGAPIRTDYIDLGDIGFRVDVDGAWTDAPSAVAFFALESEDGSVRGVIAIDVKSADIPGTDFGGCSLLSTDGRVVCEENILVDWLPGLADGVDGGSFAPGPCKKGEVWGCARFVLPVESVGGSDLLLVDYRPLDACLGCDHPLFVQYTSVKQLNSLGSTPTDFPGFERDVDNLITDDACVTENKILVPVEGLGDVGDVYLLESDGTADWVLSLDAGPGVPAIPGFETGVDIVQMCGLGGPSPDRLVVPIENAAGTDADLWIVDFDTGERLASVEVANPGLSMPGFEVGVDPVLWSSMFAVVPTENLAGEGVLMIFAPDAVLVGIDPYGDYGFVRSVDPVVTPAAPYPMFVPIMSTDGLDAKIMMYSGPPPAIPGVSLEDVNDDLAFGGFEWDVDLGLVYNGSPGNAWVYLPEEKPNGATARVRFEPFPTLLAPRLIVATKSLGALTPSLYFILAVGGDKELEFTDVLGLETGLDLASGRGPIVHTDPPGNVVPGQDADTDPTLGWDIATSILGGPARTPSAWIPVNHPNPFVAPGRIEYALPERGRVTVEVFDVAGRMVSRLYDGIQDDGEHALAWNAVDSLGRRLASGVYFVRVRMSHAVGVSKLVLVR